MAGDWTFLEKMYSVCSERLYIFDGLSRADHSLLMAVAWTFYICGGLPVKYPTI